MLLSKKSDWLGVNQVEVLKGLFNRFPMISYLNTDKQLLSLIRLRTFRYSKNSKRTYKLSQVRFTLQS